MPFAQLILGPPGSGKTTYCDGMAQFLGAIGRKCSVVNLDPANGAPSYDAALDVRDLVALEDVMRDDHLGPNGAVLYALEALEANFAWLETGLKELGEDYVLFDCPGQVEVFTHHDSLRNVFFKLQKMGYRLVVLHLTDSYCLTLPSLYISTLLLSLRAMLQMDLPQLNVLTKIDNLANYDRLPFPLEFYTNVQDLSYLLPHLESESPHFSAKFTGLNEAIISLVDDFGLVGFETLAVEDKRSMMTLLQAVDRAGGYAFGSAEGAGDSVWQVAMREGYRGLEVGDVQERWIDRRDEFDELERQQEKSRMEQERQRAENIAETAAMAKAAEAPNSNDDDNDDLDEQQLEEFRRRGTDSGIKVVRKG